MFAGCQPVSFQVGDYNPGTIGGQVELEYDVLSWNHLRSRHR